jgi:hypothetical protein
MKVLLIIGIVIVVIISFFIMMNQLFYNKFRKQADHIIIEAGKQDTNLITEEDLATLPIPIARYIRFSGLIGLRKISTMRLVHSGSFKPGINKKFLPVVGEYSLTTKKPSFSWFGKIAMIPGLTVSAFDSYYNGHGRMTVKLLSAFKIVDVDSKEIGLSAFGRCVAEMTLVPSFFLDNKRVKWLNSDSTKAECQITDLDLITNAQLYFNKNGSLDKVVVDRYFERDNGEATLEKFTAKGQDIKDFNGLKLASIVDGYWNLKEGDLHYVHFIIEKVEFN